MQNRMSSKFHHTINKVFKKIFFLTFDFINLYRVKLKEQKIGENKNSVSTFIKYTGTVQSFLESDKRFRKFRQSPFYKVVLEHV